MEIYLCCMLNNRHDKVEKRKIIDACKNISRDEPQSIYRRTIKSAKLCIQDKRQIFQNDL